jgi:hypothetical protein
MQTQNRNTLFPSILGEKAEGCWRLCNQYVQFFLHRILFWLSKHVGCNGWNSVIRRRWIENFGRNTYTKRKLILHYLIFSFNLLLLYSLVWFRSSQRNVACWCELVQNTVECEFLFLWIDNEPSIFHKAASCKITSFSRKTIHLGKINSFLYIHTHIHTYTHTYTHTHIHTYIHTYTHTHIHTYIHTYIHSFDTGV